jgi:predicted Zn finger-like uncharacterized protein
MHSSIPAPSHGRALAVAAAGLPVPAARVNNIGPPRGDGSDRTERAAPAMILTCPACNSRYRVDGTAIASASAAGRQVRCVRCGHTWHQPPEAPAALEPAPIPAAEPAPETPPFPAPLPDPALAPPPPALRSAWVGIRGFALVVVLAGLVLGGVFARHVIVALWPATASVYGAVGLPVEPLGAGLEIRKVIPTRTGEGVVVEGDIVNIDGGARAVPRLRVALLDPAQNELRSEIITLPKDRLQPGESTHFRAPFAKTDDTATKVAVTWASG